MTRSTQFGNRGSGQGDRSLIAAPLSLPADHVDPEAITVSDFRIEDGEAKDEYGRTIIVPTCVECPSGQKPHRSFYDDFLKQIIVF